MMMIFKDAAGLAVRRLCLGQHWLLRRGKIMKSSVKLPFTGQKGG